MKNKYRGRPLHGWLQWIPCVSFLIPAVFTTLAGSPQTLSADQLDSACMQDIANFDLNCTANDIQISGVAKNPDGSDQLVIHDDGCAYPGDTVTFTATFDVLVTARERHDIGIYFVTDGDPNGDGAISGACNISTMPHAPEPTWLDLDGTSDPFPGTNTTSGQQDLCGDIDKPDHNPLKPTVTLTALCIDPDQDGFLNLPNCTSWRQSGANELCTSPLDAYPGAPSKCRCDDAFQLPIEVPPARLLVTKTASPVSVDEPGGSVSYTVTVTNIGIDPNNPVTLNSLTDDIYGDITQVQGAITATDCSVTQLIPVDDANIGGIDTYTCSFTADVTGNAGDSETDTVTATGIDARNNPISGSDTATVTISDLQPAITVVKLASPTEVFEPGGPVSFSIKVTNNSAGSDPVTMNSLTDSIYGNLDGKGDCAVPQVLAGNGGSYSCSFTANVAGNYADTETDTVTASGTDDDGNPVSDSDSATVMVVNVPSQIELIKTANPTTVNEPGGSVTYTFTVNNKSGVDTVTINSLMDNILGDLGAYPGSSCSLPQQLAPDDGAAGGPDSYTCSVVAAVSGNASQSVTNTASASGADDDGEAVAASDSATVDINNVPPAASLTKTVTGLLVTYRVQVCNDSDAESLTLNALSDDLYGSITADAANPALESTTCVVPQTLQLSGEAGSCYTCSFKAATTTSTTTDTVTGTVDDDDGSLPASPSDSATVSF